MNYLPAFRDRGWLGPANGVIGISGQGAPTEAREWEHHASRRDG